MFFWSLSLLLLQIIYIFDERFILEVDVRLYVLTFNHQSEKIGYKFGFLSPF